MTNLVSSVARSKTPHVHEASPGIRTFFPSYTRHIYCKRFRAVIGLWLVWQSHPRLQPLYDFCPSGQSFAASFLQIPRRRGHPCLWLYPSHCRVDSGLSPARTCARRAHHEKPGFPKPGNRAFSMAQCGKIAFLKSVAAQRFPASLAHLSMVLADAYMLLSGTTFELAAVSKVSIRYIVKFAMLLCHIGRGQND